MDIIKSLREIRGFHQSIVDGNNHALKEIDLAEETAFNHRSRVYVHEDFVKTCDKAIEAITGKSE